MCTGNSRSSSSSSNIISSSSSSSGSSSSSSSPVPGLILDPVLNHYYWQGPYIPILPYIPYRTRDIYIYIYISYTVLICSEVYTVRVCQHLFQSSLNAAIRTTHQAEDITCNASKKSLGQPLR